MLSAFPKPVRPMGEEEGARRGSLTPRAAG